MDSLHNKYLEEMNETAINLLESISPIQDTHCVQKIVAKGTTLQTKPKTNADRIRAMSDEELTRWLLQFVIDCAEKTTGEECEFEDGAEEELQEWLQQPAEDMEKGGQL